MYSTYSPGQALEAWPQASAIVVYNDYNQRELYTGRNLNKMTSKKITSERSILQTQMHEHYNGKPA